MAVFCQNKIKMSLISMKFISYIANTQQARAHTRGEGERIHNFYAIENSCILSFMPSYQVDCLQTKTKPSYSA